ncbi:Rad17 cell cycle checkpoint protein-domain-containing protein [Globomyces pollinis-pini]|nr:Rad17 cell cycle checkpoint protein-domain-containing protein [Globomyces pollinis-pini]
MMESNSRIRTRQNIIDISSDEDKEVEVVAKKSTKSKRRKSSKRPRKEDTSTVDFHSINYDRILDIDEIEETAVEPMYVEQTSLHTTQTKDTQLYLIKYEPKTIEDLAIHKKKLSDVEAWFKVLEDQSSTPRILLLSGPSGSGKTATIKCFAQKFGYNIKEWENPINTNKFNSSYTEGSTFADYLSNINLFANFIQSCSKKTQLKFNTNVSLDTSKTIALIEETPNIHLESARNTLFTALQNYINSPFQSIPIIVIISDSHTNLENTSMKPLSKRTFFPSSVLNNHRFQEITFNPIAKTFLIKALQKIRLAEFGNELMSKSIEEIVSSSNGDIRTAVNNFQFSKLISDSPLTFDTGNQKDVSLFHGLGKILHNKRSEASSTDTMLNENLVSKKRDCLSYDPEALFESLHMESQYFLLFLQQNYSTHCNDIFEAFEVSESLSDSDLYLRKWENVLEMGKYAASVAIRGTAMSLHPTTTASRTRFTSHIKPQYWTNEQKRKENECLWNNDMSKNYMENYFLKIDNPNEFSLSNHHGKLTVMQDTIPFLGLINRFPGKTSVHNLPIHHRQYLSGMCAYNNQIKSQLFFEKDTMDCEEEMVNPSLETKVETASLQFLNVLKRSQNSELYLIDDDIED